MITINDVVRPSQNPRRVEDDRNQIRKTDAKKSKTLSVQAGFISTGIAHRPLKFSYRPPKIFADLNDKNLSVSLAENLQDLKDKNVDIDRKIEIVEDLRKTHPGSSYLAEAILIVADALWLDEKDQDAIKMYTEILHTKTYQGTKYSRRANFMLAEIYMKMDPPQLKQSEVHLLATLDNRRPEQNLPAYYELAKLWENIDGPEHSKAYAYYLKFFESYKTMVSLKQKGSALSYEEAGFSGKDTSCLFDGLIGFARMALRKKDTMISIKAMGEIASFAMKTKADPRAQKLGRTAANEFLSALKISLSSKDLARAGEYTRGMAYAAVTLGEDRKSLSKLYEDAVVSTHLEISRLIKSRRIDAAISLAHSSALLLPSVGNISRASLKTYLELLEELNKSRRYGDAKKLFSAILPSLWDESSHNSCERESSEPILACVDYVDEIGKEALISHINSYFATAAKTFGDLQKGRSAALYAMQASKEFESLKRTLFFCEKNTNSNAADIEMGYAMANEFSGRKKEAIENLKAVKDDNSVDTRTAQEAAFRLALLENDIKAAESILKEENSLSISHKELLKAAKSNVESGNDALAGMKNVYFEKGILIRQMGSHYFLFDVLNNKLLTSVAGKRFAARNGQIAFPAEPLLGRKYAVVFKVVEPDIVANHEALLETVASVPKDLHRGLNTIYFTKKSASGSAGECWGSEIYIYERGGSTDVVTHEMGHLWDNMNSAKAYLFRGISWSGGGRREYDQRDFTGSCNVVIKNQRGSKAFTSDDSRIRCSDIKLEPYGMKNSAEDLASFIEDYFANEELRSEIRKGIGNKIKNFEPAIKYLFVKYMGPFAGKEYHVTKENLGIDISDVETQIARWLKANPNDKNAARNLAILRAIKRYTSR